MFLFLLASLCPLFSGLQATLGRPTKDQFASYSHSHHFLNENSYIYRSEPQAAPSSVAEVGPNLPPSTSVKREVAPGVAAEAGYPGQYSSYLYPAPYSYPQYLQYYGQTYAVTPRAYSRPPPVYTTPPPVYSYSPTPHPYSPSPAPSYQTPSPAPRYQPAAPNYPQPAPLLFTPAPFLHLAHTPTALPATTAGPALPPALHHAPVNGHQAAPGQPARPVHPAPAPPSQPASLPAFSRNPALLPATSPALLPAGQQVARPQLTAIGPQPAPVRQQPAPVQHPRPAVRPQPVPSLPQQFQQQSAPVRPVPAQPRPAPPPTRPPPPLTRPAPSPGQSDRSQHSRALQSLLEVAGESWDPAAAIEKNLLVAAGGKFECPAREGHFPAPDSCSHYYQCAHGSAIQHQCQDGLMWNVEREQCDWSSNVDCSLNRQPLRPAEALHLIPAEQSVRTLQHQPAEHNTLQHRPADLNRLQHNALQAAAEHNFNALQAAQRQQPAEHNTLQQALAEHSANSLQHHPADPTTLQHRPLPLHSLMPLQHSTLQHRPTERWDPAEPAVARELIDTIQRWDGPAARSDKLSPTSRSYYPVFTRN